MGTLLTYNLDNAIAELKSLSVDTPKKPELPDGHLIHKYEEKIGFKFPDDYKRFLMEASDVCVGTLSPLIVTNDINAPGELSLALAEGREFGLPEDWLPICEDNGDYYCILADGKIRFWSHDGATDDRWPNLETWIKEVWIGNG